VWQFFLSSQETAVAEAPKTPKPEETRQIRVSLDASQLRFATYRQRKYRPESGTRNAAPSGSGLKVLGNRYDEPKKAPARSGEPTISLANQCHTPT